MNIRLITRRAASGLVFGIIIFVLAAIPRAKAAGPWYVASTGNDANSCASPAAPCATISGALGKASGNDTIYVETGTYVGTGWVALEITKPITLSGGWNSDFSRQVGLSILDGQKQHPVAYIKCPVCSQLMNRVNFGVRSGVIIDRCRDHGVWLDGGELRHLMEWMKLGGKLLDQERQEQTRKEELKQESEQRRRPAGYSSEPSPFDNFGDPLRQSDPDLFDIIYQAIRFFTR